MPEQLPDEHPEPETQPRSEQVPPGEPPATTTMLEDCPPARYWGVLETLPVVLFLLVLTGLSLVTAMRNERNVSPGNVVPALIMQAVLYVLILLYVNFVVKVWHRLPFWTALGWNWIPPGRYVFAGIGLAVFVQLLHLPAGKKLPIERLFENAQAAYLLAGFGIVIAPLVEEILFRGFVFVAVERAAGIRHAVWVTAVLFAFVHVPQLMGGIPQMVAILGVGLVLGWVRGATRSLAASYFVHLSYNTTLFAMLFAATQGFQRWS